LVVQCVCCSSGVCRGVPGEGGPGEGGGGDSAEDGHADCTGCSGGDDVGAIGDVSEPYQNDEQATARLRAVE
jgi:hypothetical protein